MYDDLVAPSLPPRLRNVVLRWLLSLKPTPSPFSFGLPQEVADPGSQCLGLEPAAICEGRIVRGRGREVPFLIGGVKPIAVPRRGSARREKTHKLLKKRKRWEGFQSACART